ncbi:MAG: hypothetical protein RLZZ341_697 [Pseudomonadota bacterium]|jgi:hypothetical protein
MEPALEDEVISREPPNSDERYKFDTYTLHVLKGGQTTKQYEDETKRRFKDEPANMKLLIVVSKLLTGFDAPSCTYIYLDNELRDHNLFQAICRTNRLDGADKDYGHIVDFKELFGDVQQAIAVYSSDELDIDEGGDKGDGGNNVELKNWLVEGKAQLDDTRQALHYLCEPVPPPRDVEQFLRYFCGDAADPGALDATEALRISFYKAVTLLARAYADIATHLTEAGYSDAEAAAIQAEVEFYAGIRASIKKHAGEELDIKPFEADMRHLLNTYVQADAASNLGDLGALSLTELIVQSGKAACDRLLALITEHPEITAQTVLEFVALEGLFVIPETLAPFVPGDTKTVATKDNAGQSDQMESAEEGESENDDTSPELSAWSKALEAPLSQIERYDLYVRGQSQFGTHQGVKGLEFSRVLVVINDDEARGFLFAYDKFFGTKEKSKADLENEAAGRETGSDRTRRLFYVTCSRAEKSLAIVYYSPDPALARNAILQYGWFEEVEVDLIN